MIALRFQRYYFLGERYLRTFPFYSVNDNQPNDDAVDVEPSQCWPQEVALVDKITAQGGIRLNPGNSELGDFVKR